MVEEAGVVEEAEEVDKLGALWCYAWGTVTRTCRSAFICTVVASDRVIFHTRSATDLLSYCDGKKVSPVRVRLDSCAMKKPRWT